MFPERFPVKQNEICTNMLSLWSVERTIRNFANLIKQKILYFHLFCFVFGILLNMGGSNKESRRHAGIESTKTHF